MTNAELDMVICYDGRSMSLTDNLLALYHADRQVRALRTRLSGAEQALARAKRAVHDSAARVTELRAQALQLKASAANIEAESGTLQARIERHRGELNKSTNMKQYEALLSEMRLLQDQRNELDSQALQFLTKADEVGAQADTAQADADRRQVVAQAAQADLATRTADVGERLAELEAARAAAAEAVPTAELTRFNHIADLTDGEAMAEVITLDARRREYACGECNMELPSFAHSAVASQPDTVHQCTTCKRILYLAAAPEKAEA